MPEEKRILNEEQQKAVEHADGPLLIIAGAGTGKTTVITERIKYLILQKEILPSEILALTFTDKAARQMEERVDVALPYGYTQMWISTFHSFCDRILRSEALHIGLTPAYKLMTEPETILFLRKHLFKFDLDYFRPLGNPNKFLEGLLQHFSRLKDEDLDPSQYLQHSQQIANRKSHMVKRDNKKRYAKPYANSDEIKKTLELANAYKVYEELKAQEGVMDFADLISNTLKLFRTRKNVLAEYHTKFKYILVDEFQDTNYAQNELAILLSGQKQNITVVGDDDQAIYRWRGAAVSNIMQFKKHFPKAKIIVLTKNYRSTQTILDSSYKLIQNNNPDRLEVKEKIDKKLTSVRKIKGENPELIYTDRVENEADAVAKKIKELAMDNEAKTQYQYKDIAILVRANNHADPFIRAFERLKIPYQFLGPGQLFRQEEIKDLIAYLKVLYNFEDSVSLYRVLSMEHFGISARDVSAILNFARRQNLSLFETLERIDGVIVASEVKEKIKYIVSMINRHLARIRKDTAGQIIYYFLEDSGLLKKVIAYKTTLDEKRAQNIAKFFDKLKTYEVEHEDAGVAAVVDWIDLSMQMGESPQASDIDWSDNNAVNILTIHSSKGLEFPIVFLVNLVTGRFPTRERREQIPIPDELIKEILPEGDYHLEEERRLCYVGMTRARDQLFLTAANYYGEGKRERKVSPFVIEALGEKVIRQSVNQEPTNGQLTLLEWKPLEPNESTMNQQPRTNLLVDYLSYSQIDTFNTCPLHFKAKYILRIPVTQTSSQSFGTTIHLTLRDFYQLLLKGEQAKEKELLDLFKKNWINDGYQSKEHQQRMFEKGKRVLQDFLKGYYDPKRLPISLELPFQFRITANGKTLRVGGKIDRIDKLENGKIEVLDYKTGTNMPDENKLVDNLQLTVYALAALEVKDILFGKKPEDVILSLYYLESGKKFTTTRTAKQLESAKEKLLEIANKISTSDFACSGSNLCINCEFKMLCRTS